MDVLPNRINNEIADSPQIPPPPYTTVVYKLNEHTGHGIFPPAYSDIDAQSITYVNNYPGPPLTDGHVQTNGEISINYVHTRRSKTIRLYLIINGIVMILIGMAIVGIEIGILVTDSIMYYYYGFWGGAIIISLGVGDVLLSKQRHFSDQRKVFRSFFWQMILTAVVLGVGVAIVLTDRCNDSGTESHGVYAPCKRSHRILDGCLLGMFALSFLLSIINTIFFGFFK